MSIIRTNRPNFFGNAGEPLQSGYIYIGQPNQDPTEFDKTVTFEDSQGNQFPAAQPLRTNGQGQIVYNGKAIIASVVGDYSMLILDSTQTQIPDGYTSLIEPTSTGGASDLTDYRQYESVLADVKQVDVAVGQTIGSIGRLAPTDNLGESWLVSFSTGSPADDLTIIDFDNGLQGLRIGNYLKPSNNLSELTDIAAARTKLDVYSEAEAIADASGTVSATNIATSAVTESKIAGSAVTQTKLATNSVKTSAIQDDAVDIDKIDYSFYSTGLQSYTAGETKLFDTGLDDVNNVPLGVVTTESNSEHLVTYYDSGTATFWISIRNSAGAPAGFTAILYYLRK